MNGSGGESNKQGSGVYLRVKQSAPIPLDAEFECAPGSLLVLAGPSGSGKSTLLRCIAGLERPDFARIIVAGNVWQDTEMGVMLPTQARSVGMVFQHYALFPHLSALQNIVLALGHRSADQRPSRARELLELVHLGGLEQRRPAELSGGQQQRVAVARALARDPQVLLLDEPFSAVDQVTRRKLQKELVAIRRNIAVPMVLVTHDLEEAALLADHLCVVHAGSSLQSGPVNEVLVRPATALVARLVNLTNLFSGTVVSNQLAGGAARIRWNGMELECAPVPDLVVGDTVDWVIPSQFIVLHRRDRPSRGERENPVAGTVTEVLFLGELASITMAPDIAADDSALQFSVPAHVARRNRIETGVPIRVSLLAEGINLMPRSHSRA